MHLTDEHVASAELEYLAQALQPPCALGSFHVTGLLARSATALLFTARGQAFGETEGVLKLTGSAYAPILGRELALLNEAASRDVGGRPVRAGVAHRPRQRPRAAPGARNRPPIGRSITRPADRAGPPGEPR